MEGHVPTDIADITLGTAGHIDHGKSALVERLTGVNPDRLKEEQVRGMTIDLGYAFYVTREGRKVGVIDVPGHERLIRNMVTGATGIDVVLLVVAADDGVMPQTREHLDIMNVLGIRRGLVALNKIDLVDEETAALAAEEVREAVAGTFLEGAPVVPVSALTGEGLERLRDHLEAVLETVDRPATSDLFRMPVQRVFSAKGFGTVVTGVPMSGTIRPRDPVEILPEGLAGKVRGLQAFGEPCPEGRAGHRVAVNISDVDYRRLRRGCMVVTPGYFTPVRFFEAWFTYFENTGFTLRNLSVVKVHHGTAEVMARIVLLDTPALRPGASGYVQLRLEEPIVAVAGDRFLVRRHSPVMSLGGGTVLRFSEGKARRFKETLLRELALRRECLGRPLPERVRVETSTWRGGPFTVREMALRVGDTVAAVSGAMEALQAEGEILPFASGRFLSREGYAVAAARVERVLDDFHETHPLLPYADVREIRGRTGLEGAFLQAIMTRMEAEGRIETAPGGKVRRGGFRVILQEEDARLAEEITRRVMEGALAPPEPETLAEILGIPPARVETLTAYLAAKGVLRNIGGFWFHVGVVDRLKEAVRECARTHGEVKIPVIRDRFGTSRKYLIPLMEYLDDTGFTRREGDRRFLKK